MDATYAAFGFQDQNKEEYLGFDVDIIETIAKAEDFVGEVDNLALTV